MNNCKSDLARSRSAKTVLLTLLTSLVIAVTAAPQLCHAQRGKSPLTPKYLIGDAVSLSNKTYPEIDKAILRFTNGDASGAQTFLERAKKKYPTLAPTDVMMAKMLLLRRDARAVHFYLERAALLHPEDPESYLILADQAFVAQRTVEALSLFEYAAPRVEKFSSNKKRKQNFKIRVMAGMAAVAERRGQWEEARTWLGKWLAADAENSTAHSRMGIVLFRLDKHTEALAAFTKAREVNPNSAHPFISLGQLFFAKGDNENARKSFDKAYQENGSDTQVAQAYAEWLIQQGKLDKAQKIAVTLQEQSPDSITALLLDGIVSYMQGQSERAEQKLQKVLSLDPRNGQATDLLALLLIQSDDVQDKERALQYAQNNAEWRASSAQANVTRAYVLYELGRKAEANKALAQAGKMTIQPDSTFLIAKILLAENQIDKAIEALKKIVGHKSGLIIFRKDAEDLLEKLTEGQ